MTEEELKRIEALIMIYFDADTYDAEDVVMLLTDLRHLCRIQGWNFGSISHQSNHFYQGEINEEEV